MITKQEFVDIIEKLKQVNDFVDETNKKARELNDAIISDFFNASSLSISHETIVVELLENMFNDKDYLSWWLYDLDYGRKFKIGYLQEKRDGKTVNIDLSTAEKLYDYLIQNLEREETNEIL